jgi:hypothetical protein
VIAPELHVVCGSSQFSLNGGRPTAEIAETAVTQLQQMERRYADWPAAAVAGFGAGAILMVLDLFWSVAVTGDGPWVASRMIAAIVMGQQVLQSSGFSLSTVTVALLAHYALGVAGGIVLVAVGSRLRLDANLGLAALTGAAFGLMLYVINFYVLVRFFPWFAEIRGWTALLINLIFGITAAVLYWKLERRDDARPALQAAR